MSPLRAFSQARDRHVPPPAELLEDVHWFACRTRARSEKKTCTALECRGFQVYLPLVEREREWQDRRKRVAFPLLPGYVFVRSPMRGILETLRIPGIVSIADPNGYPTPVREQEITSLRILVDGANQTGILPSPADFLQPGDEVMVHKGPFQGMTGILFEHRGTTRVVVRINALRHAISVELDRSVIRPPAT